MGKPEGTVEDYLKKYSEQSGFMCLKFKSPATSGVPDRILIGRGFTFFVETKAPKETLRELQEEIHLEMKQHGALVFTCDTKEKCKQLIDIFKSAPHQNYTALNALLKQKGN